MTKAAPHPAPTWAGRLAQLVGLATVGALEVEVLAVARHLRSLRDLIQWVRHRVDYMPEPREHFSTAGGVLRSQADDCDGHAVLVGSLAHAMGLPARLRLFAAYPGGPPAHVAAEVFEAGAWRVADTTPQPAQPWVPIGAPAPLPRPGRACCPSVAARPGPSLESPMRNQQLQGGVSAAAGWIADNVVDELTQSHTPCGITRYVHGRMRAVDDGTAAGARRALGLWRRAVAETNNFAPPVASGCPTGLRELRAYARQLEARTRTGGVARGHKKSNRAGVARGVKKPTRGSVARGVKKTTPAGVDYRAVTLGPIYAQRGQIQQGATTPQPKKKGGGLALVLGAAGALSLGAILWSLG